MAKQKKKDYSAIYLVIGLVLAFVCLLALFQWGFLGILIANLVRLVVGEAYDLLLVFLLYLAGGLIAKGYYTSIGWRKRIGSFMIFSAITLLLHVEQFAQVDLLNQSIFKETFQIFRNELLAMQIDEVLGGGMLGALYFELCGYLFGKWGSYLLAGLVFAIGLFLFLEIPHKAFVESMKAVGRLLKRLVYGFGNSLLSIRTVFNARPEAGTFTSEDESVELQVEESWEEMNIEQEDFQPAVEKKAPRKRKWGVERLFSFLDEDEPKQTPRFEANYQPAFRGEERHYSEPYTAKEPPAQTAARERSTQEEVVLDLDYFDQMQDPPKRRPLDVPASRNVEIVGPDLGEVPLTEPTSLESHVEQAKAPIPSNDQALETEIKAEATSPVESREVEAGQVSDAFVDRSNKGDSAMHWQEGANQTQSLTSDAMDEQLAADDAASMKQKPTQRSKGRQYQLPSKALLTKREPVDQSEEYEHINRNIDKLEQTFASFGVDATVVKANLGPAVTKYEVEPAVGVKVSKIVSLSDDIALALAARDVRMEAPIPGKSLIGIEVPNKQISPVSYYEIVDAATDSKKILEVPLGRDVSGQICLADLSKMPHLLMAGATGSGKSVGMNVIITSLLMKARPDEVKFLMIDPKKVELTMYNDIPHLLSPVVTNPRKAARALNNVVEEMERRYELFAASGVRNQDSYNEYVDELNRKEGTAYERLPKIVVFVDELADLMLVASNEVETAITRLAQMARAAGIHMIIATQRPSVDVITGIIKANIPSRLAFAVSSGTDSRTILDSNGAEKLLGRGDMLFQPMGMNKPIRVQGAYISDAEVERVADFIRQQAEPDYDEAIIVTDEAMEQADVSEDEYFDEAVELVKTQETVSISQLQRKFRIGYNRAARLIDDLEAMGYVGPADGSKPREVFIQE